MGGGEGRRERRGRVSQGVMAGGRSLRTEEGERCERSHHHLFQVGSFSSRAGLSPFCHPAPLGESVAHSRCMFVGAGGTDEEGMVVMVAR